MVKYTYRYYTSFNTPKKIKEFIYELDQEFFPGCVDVQWTNTDWIICYNKGTPIAYGAITWKSNNTYGFLSRAGVHEDHRGHGIQKEMIKRRVAAAKKLGIIYVMSYTVPSGYASSNSLINNGFKLYKLKKIQ